LYFLSMHFSWHEETILRGEGQRRCGFRASLVSAGFGRSAFLSDRRHGGREGQGATPRRAIREGRWRDTHLLKSSTRYSISCGRGKKKGERVRTGADSAFARSRSDRTTGGERASPHAPSWRSRTPAASWRPSPRGRAWTCRRGCPAAPSRYQLRVVEVTILPQQKPTGAYFRRMSAGRLAKRHVSVLRVLSGKGRPEARLMSASGPVQPLRCARRR
jgi:hypothetical protein